MPTKQCTKCKEIKELELFGKNKKRKNGLSSTCKACSRARQKAYSLLPYDPPSPIKICSDCRIGKPPTEFYNNCRAKDGLNSTCKPCSKEQGRIKRENVRKLFSSPPIGNKNCRNCKIEKPKTEFNRSSGYPDGVSTICRDCEEERREIRMAREIPVILDGAIKRCTSCNTDKEVTEFNKQKGGKDGIRSSCRDCERSNQLERDYGIDKNEYDRMLEKQEGLCAICRIAESLTFNEKVVLLSVDHCHATGKVRGLLCRACNMAIGALRDDPKILDRAANYLRENGN
jgi:hypothetical protein